MNKISCKIEIHDQRGLIIWEQDYELHVTGHAFNEKGNEARKFYQVTNLQEAILNKVTEFQTAFKKTGKPHLTSSPDELKDIKDSKPNDLTSNTRALSIPQELKTLTFEEAKTNAVTHLDEIQRTYSPTDQVNKETKFRDAKPQKTTQNYFNNFDEQTDQGDGSSIIFKWKRGPDGQVFATNEGGIWKIMLRNLKGEITSTTLSGTIDLSSYSYGDLISLINKSLSDVNIQKTDVVRDLAGQPTTTILPGILNPKTKAITASDPLYDDLPELIDEDSSLKLETKKEGAPNIIFPFRQTGFNAWALLFQKPMH